jgi:hypothetical protein
MGAFLENLVQHRYMRVITLVLGLLAIALIMLWVRALYGSIQAYHQGEAYLRANQYIRAITFFDRSIRWYAPLNPYVRQSAQQLWKIGLKAEQQGDVRLALIATRTMRRGFYAARSFYTPGTECIKKCDAKINELMGVEQSKKEALGGQARPGKSEFATLEQIRPSTFWSIIVEIGFLGWVGSTVAFIVFACKGHRKAKLLALPGLGWASLALFFFALWIIAMMKA